MTQFEYLAVLLSIVLSFGIIRLLDGLPSATRSGRRHPVHLAWLILVLWVHIQFWWASWGLSTGIEWTYPRFLLVLASPLLLYSLAITLVPRDARAVESWRDHFERVRPRFFGLFAAWIFVIAAASWLVLGRPVFTRLRLGQGVLLVLFGVATRISRPWFHVALVVLMSLAAILLISNVFFEVGVSGP